MKTRITNFNDFVLNEKAMSIIGEKGVIANLQMQFKNKYIANLTMKDNTVENVLSELNGAWEKFKQTELEKTLIDLILKPFKNKYPNVEKDKYPVTCIVTNLLSSVWEFNEIKSRPVGGDIYVELNSPVYIGVGIGDDIDAHKFAKQLNGYVNDLLPNEEIFGTYDEKYDYGNNIEISGGQMTYAIR